jgi:hypothetical protein
LEVVLEVSAMQVVKVAWPWSCQRMFPAAAVVVVVVTDA